VFQPTSNLIEIVLRVLLVYAGLSLLIRLTRKKELGQLAPMDFLTMLIVSETISPALTAGDSSVTAGLVAATALMSLTFLIDWLTFRSESAARLLHGSARMIIDDGEVIKAAQRREKLTVDEITAAVRSEGVEAIAGVKRAFVETNGRITVIPKDA